MRFISKKLPLLFCLLYVELERAFKLHFQLGHSITEFLSTQVPALKKCARKQGSLWLEIKIK